MLSSPSTRVLADAVVDALVTTADQPEAVTEGQLGGQRLVEAATPGPEQVERSHRVGGLDGGEQRLGLHHHAGAAAEGRVVHRAVDVGGLVARIVEAEVEQRLLLGLAEQALGAERLDQPGEDGEHVDAHGLQAYGAMIFHLTEPARWHRSLAEGVHTGSTRGVELADEGYIHCSTAAQWPGVRAAFYADVADLLLLHVDESLLTSPVVVEQLDGAPEPFPHVYGPINLTAIVTVEPLTPLA